MPSVLEKLLAKTGKSSDFRGNSKIGQIFRKQGVGDSKELARIIDLPRRTWSEDDTNFADDVTDFLKLPQGTMKLRQIQAIALREMHDYGGLFGSIKVGAGKTLLSALAPTLLESKRPLLLIPAKLREKTKRDFIELRKHWQMVDEIRVESYEMISRAPKPTKCETPECKCELFSGETVCVCKHDLSKHAAPSILDEYMPDLIIADESSHVKNPRAAVTRRVSRFMQNHPTTRFVALSGTIAKRSLRDYHHIIAWCLPRIMPLPRSWNDLQEWADCLDEDVEIMMRQEPGALVKLMNGEELTQAALGYDDALSAVRKAYRRRLVDTAGVVATSERHLGCSLSIEVIEPHYKPAERPDCLSVVNEAFRQLREDEETPDGWPVADPSAMWRHARELALGFYYRWNPRPPDDWLVARRIWAKFVRDTIRYNRVGIDSELQVAQRYSHTDEYLCWKEIRDTFKPNVEPVWFEDSIIQHTTRWMKDNPGIVWVEHRAFGHELSKVSRVPYYSDDGCDQAGRPIEEADVTKPLIASIASNAEGRNLQGWHENLIVSMPPTGTIAEQLIGRTHRPGQMADNVSVEILVGCIESWEGLLQAKSDARYLYESLGQEQKLLHADWITSDTDITRSRANHRWVRPQRRDDDDDYDYYENRRHTGHDDRR